MQVRVQSGNTVYTKEHIIANLAYEKNEIKRVWDSESNSFVLRTTPQVHAYTLRTRRTVHKTGVMFVGWGGNNGSTVTAGILANKHKISWTTKEGVRHPNYFGSLTQSSTMRLGLDEHGKEVFVPFSSVLPMLHPNDLCIGGWDISGLNLAAAMKRACVLDHDLQTKLAPMMETMKPLPSIYYPDFIAANQEDRADNLIPSGTKQQDLDHIRKDIRDFKKANDLDMVIVLWTANTERFTDVRSGLNMTAEEVLASIRNNDPEISPSQIFAVAAILEGCPYINGSPQNTLVPGVVKLAESKQVFVAGDDFKSGQTKMKSVLVEFLVNSGIKVESIVSYNHLGNNDGKNLSSERQFRSKEISKSSVVDDMVAANTVLYKPGDHPDHVVVIKYVPFVKDSKRAMDEYCSSIFMNGINTIAIHNTCEDSLLAAPLMIDLIVLTELMARVNYKTPELEDWEPFHAVLSVLSFLLKAPMVQERAPVVNAFSRQFRSITNTVRALVGLPPNNDMLLEFKTKLPAGRPKPKLISKL